MNIPSRFVIQFEEIRTMAKVGPMSGDEAVERRLAI